MKKISLGVLVLLGAILSPIVRAQATPDTQPPENMVKPAIVTAVGNGSVSLSWDALKDNTGVKEYKIYYSTQSFITKDPITNKTTATFDKFQKTPETKITINTLQNGQRYFFTITAVDASGNESEYIATEVQAIPTVTATTASQNPSPSTSPSPVPKNSPSPQPTATIKPTTEPTAQPMPLVPGNTHSGPSSTLLVLLSIATTAIYTVVNKRKYSLKKER